MRTIVCLLLLAWSLLSNAEPIFVIVRSDTKITQISEVDLGRLYLGRISDVDGVELSPIDYKDELSLAQKFRSRVLKKNPLQYQQYWARLIFTGKARPPLSSIESSEEMIRYILNNKDSIGYTNLKNLPDRARVVLVIEKSE